MGDDVVDRMRRIDLGRMECFRAMEQAADEIERLRAEVETLQTWRNADVETFHRQQAENDRLRAESELHQAEITYLRDVERAARQLLRHHIGQDKGWYVGIRGHNGGGWTVHVILDGIYTHQSDAEAVRDVVWQPALDALVDRLGVRALSEDDRD